jgi:hypothetical protein
MQRSGVVAVAAFALGNDIVHGKLLRHKNGVRQPPWSEASFKPHQMRSGFVNTPDDRWLGNGYFMAQGIETIAHASSQADMSARAPEHLAGLKVLKERLDGTVPTLPARFIKESEARLELGGVVFELKHWGGGHTPGDWLVWLPQKNVLFSGDVVYVDRVLGLHPVSRTKTWLASRAHLGRAVEAGEDISVAVKRFDARPFAHLKHAEVWIPQLANQTYLEMERE